MLIRVSGLAHGQLYQRRLRAVGPGQLSELLGLPALHDDNLLVGYASSDDAAVYSWTAAVMVMTVIFPAYGERPGNLREIAAANALSDIYAMGAQPLVALNIVCFPQAMDRRF